MLASKLPICSIFGSAMSGSKELIAILSEEIMSYAFKNTAISKQLLRVALALRRDFRKWRRMCKDSQRFFQDFAVTASLDTLSANFAQTIAEDIGDWELALRLTCKKFMHC